MLLLNIAVALLLLAVGLGVGFLIWGFRNQGVGTLLAKVFGFIILIVATLAMLCVGLHAMKAMAHDGQSYHKMKSGNYAHNKQFKGNRPQKGMRDQMPGNNSQGCPMMQRKMQQMQQGQGTGKCPMMQQRMQDKGDMSQNEAM